MHNAPSVIYPVGRCRLVAALLGLLAIVALLMLILWWTTAIEPSPAHRWVTGTGTLLWLGWGIWAARDWLRSPRGWLEWDAHAPAASMVPSEGQGAWRWRGTEPGDTTSLSGIELVADLQILALVRLQGAGRHPRWTWMEHWRAPARWNDLRRALHSPHA